MPMVSMSDTAGQPACVSKFRRHATLDGGCEKARHERRDGSADPSTSLQGPKLRQLFVFGPGLLGENDEFFDRGDAHSAPVVCLTGLAERLSGEAAQCGVAQFSGVGYVPTHSLEKHLEHGTTLTQVCQRSGPGRHAHAGRMFAMQG